MGEGDRLAHAYAAAAVFRQGTGDRLCEHDPRRARSLRGDQRQRLSRSGAASGSARSTSIISIAATGTYFLTADDAHALIARPRSIADEATPAATGIMVGNLAELFLLTAEPAYRERAEALLATLAGEGGRDVVTTASLAIGLRRAAAGPPGRHRGQRGGAPAARCRRRLPKPIPRSWSWRSTTTICPTGIPPPARRRLTAPPRCSYAMRFAVFRKSTMRTKREPRSDRSRRGGAL